MVRGVLYLRATLLVSFYIKTWQIQERGHQQLCS